LLPSVSETGDFKVIRCAVTCSLVPAARGGPFVFHDDLAGAFGRASALGFDGVELFPPGPEVVEPQAVRKLMDDHGLALAAVGTGAGWVQHRLHLCLPDAGARAKAREFIRSIIDFAGPLGAPAIIGSMQGRSDEAVDPAAAGRHLAEALEDLGEHARRYNVPLLLEPLNRYETNLVVSLEAGVKLLRSLSTKNVLLLADLFHMNVEEEDLAAALRGVAGLIGHVHFVDSNRRAAGFGHLDYPPIAQALREMKYDRFVSAEALPWPDSEGAAKQTIGAFRRYFRDGQ
jgi:sugar phosphate isomerase/epimerase